MIFEKDSLGIQILNEENLQFGYFYKEKEEYLLMLFKDKLSIEEFEEIFEVFKNLNKK